MAHAVAVYQERGAAVSLMAHRGQAHCYGPFCGMFASGSNFILASWNRALIPDHLHRRIVFCGTFSRIGAVGNNLSVVR